MDIINYERFAYYIFDRVMWIIPYYIKSQSLMLILLLVQNQMYKIDKSTGVIYDQTGKIEGFYTSKDYPDKIRKVKFFDAENKKMLIFLTNNFDLSAQQIALLYKQRWKIELFFKWIKQHLKVKTF
jgi:IS4 transposase